MTSLAINARRLPWLRSDRRPLDWVTRGCLLVIVLIALCAAFAPVLAPYSPNQVDPVAILQAPSGAHPLGTDAVGRDILSRLLYGARTSLVAPLIVVGIATTSGILLGLVSGWVGGVVDAVISRALDILFAIPSVILAILAASLFGQGIIAPGVALCLAYTPYLARVVRAGCVRERSLPYVEALWSQGAGVFAIWRRHLLPSLMPLILVQAALTYGYAMSDFAAIDFLGFGVQPPTADWGLMVAQGQTALLQGAAEQSIFGGVLIVIVVVAFNLLGDRLAARWAIEKR
jgi:peptide/nickel transport system permease protein